MKIQKILESNQLFEQQLDELSLKHALAAGVAGASLMGAPNHSTPQEKPPVTHVTKKPQTVQMPDDVVTGKSYKQYIQDTAQQISKKYSVNPKLAKQIVQLAHKYQKPDFPTAQDILSIIGIESSFDPSKQSNLADDPAVGLMQIRPGVWNLDPDKLSTVENQIKYGSEILHKYYRYLKNEEDAIKGYNIGLTNFLKGRGEDSALRYLTKFKQELASYGEA